MENNLIIGATINENGHIQNMINFPLFLNPLAQDKEQPHPEVYFSFVLKTLIDNFGDQIYKKFSEKEQFEARLISNLTKMLAEKTK